MILGGRGVMYILCMYEKDVLILGGGDEMYILCRRRMY